ncbi:MAG: cellulose binding domain-containing protein [Lachnospiraceae bacterium]|nr:cellulose binding domain-containing protein [Lachnospiraceae bacterium]
MKTNYIWKKDLCIVLSLCLLIVNINSIGVQAKERVLSKKDCSVDNMLDIEYHVTAKWENHYNVDVTFKNISDIMIDDWEISFDLDADIEKIWNANITEHEEDKYVIHNDGRNKDIKEGSTVTFGMTIKCDNDLEFPTNFYLTREPVEVENGYSIKYKEDSRKDNVVSGRIIITNESDKVIENWKLDVTIDNLKSFDNLKDVELISNDKKGSFRFNNAEYNQNIPVGQSVEFGFIAKCSGSIKIVASTLYEMYDDFFYDDGNYIDKKYLDEEVVYNLEDFESSEEYLYFMLCKRNSNINQSLAATVKDNLRKIVSNPLERNEFINTICGFINQMMYFFKALV